MADEPDRGWLGWFRRRRGATKVGFGVWVLVALVVLGAAYAAVLEYQRPHVEGQRLRFDRFVDLVVDGRVHSATVLDQDAYVVGTFTPSRDGQAAQDTGGAEAGGESEAGAGGEATGEGGGDAAAGRVVRFNTPLVDETQAQTLQLLVDEEVPTTVDQQVGKQIAELASMLLPGVMLVVLFIYLILSYRNGTGLFGVTSGAREFAPDEATSASFADVAGQPAAVAELAEVADFLADPGRFGRVGAVAPSGILLYGPPGCGKTLLAKALAGEAGARFFSISGSDFVELYAGVGAARVRELFRQAREAAPALVFIDELDSIGRARAASNPTGSQGEQEQALNQILAELDGFSPTEGLIVLAATNRPDMLDQALLRPGRFDRTVGLERPDEAGRLAILQVHAQRRALDADVDLAAIAAQAVGLTGADLATVANEAALLAARAGKAAIGHGELEAAVARVIEAPERQRRLALGERSIAKTATGDERVTLADVAGVDKAADELDEITAYLADPDRFAAMGARGPQGVLLAGPPGCGKTLLARALAGEANAAFLSAAGSEFVEVYAGKGAARVRDLFAEATARAPAIVFLDEIDAIGSARSGTGGGDTSEREQTLNQVLVELDGFESRSGVVAIAATNRADMLDAALTRPGRFDRHIAVELPDVVSRQAILQRHASDKPVASDVDLAAVAAATPGFSGAALATVVNDAALLATRRGHEAIAMGLLEEAIDRAAQGVAARQWIMTHSERQVAAYHEAGRGLTACALTGHPPAKLSLAASGPQRHPLGDEHGATYTRQALINHMAVTLAGRAAEEFAFDDVSTTAAHALADAERLAHHMVCHLAMSAKLAPLALPQANGYPAYSEHTARLVDAEKHALVTEAYQHAWDTLTAHRDALQRVATALLDHESVTAEHLTALVNPTGSQPASDTDQPAGDARHPGEAQPASDPAAPADDHPG
jgi:cell division protease FtsH